MKEAAPKNEGLSPRVQEKLKEIKSEAAADFRTLSLKLNALSSAREIMHGPKEVDTWVKKIIEDMREFREFTDKELFDLRREVDLLDHAEKRNYI